MTVILYKTNSDTRKLNKNLTRVASVNVTLKNADEIVNPTLILSAAYLPPSANYAYIEKLKRYYYITGQRILPGNQIELNCKSDVLMSFKDTILNSTVVARRSANNYNKLLPDTIPLQANRNVLYRQFSGGSVGFGSGTITDSSRCYCLTVLNGGTQLNPPAGLVIAVSGMQIAVHWENVTGAFDYDVVYKLNTSDTWIHYTNTATIQRYALITVDEVGTYDIGVAPKDISGGIIGAYTYGTADITGG